MFMPGSLDELWPVLGDHPGSRLFCGGTDLLVWLRGQRGGPAALVGLERIDALQGVSTTDEGVRIGAATTHAALLDVTLVNRHFPILIQALKTLGSPHIRCAGTLGGNIVTASPAGDTLPPLYVLGAKVELCSEGMTRTLPLEDFIRGPGLTTLAPGEILSAVTIPEPRGLTLQHFQKVGLRDAMACAVASLAALMAVSEQGIIERVR